MSREFHCNGCAETVHSAGGLWRVDGCQHLLCRPCREEIRPRDPTTCRACICSVCKEKGSSTRGCCSHITCVSCYIQLHPTDGVTCCPHCRQPMPYLYVSNLILSVLFYLQIIIIIYLFPLLSFLFIFFLFIKGS